ncbi:hypothetical protein M3Y97_00190900 [Aphelenchoides bicaudatus]|nr:hypothetical protein M3Y97_00190900 [Aphelenchoides bicaudatus]
MSAKLQLGLLFFFAVILIHDANAQWGGPSDPYWCQMHPRRCWRMRMMLMSDLMDRELYWRERERLLGGGNNWGGAGGNWQSQPQGNWNQGGSDQWQGNNGQQQDWNRGQNGQQQDQPRGPPRTTTTERPTTTTEHIPGPPGI